jgi:hypothetical protein
MYDRTGRIKRFSHQINLLNVQQIMSIYHHNVFMLLLLVVMMFQWAVLVALGQSKYSSFKCIGGHDMEGVEIMRRKCYFTNLCHKSGEGDILHYYVDKGVLARPVLQNGNTIRYDFPPDFLPLGTFEKFATKWAPQTTYETMPTDAKFIDASRAILFQSYSEKNPGHFFDFLNTIFTLPQMFGFEFTNDTKILMAKEGFDAKVSKKNRDELMSALTIHKIENLADLGDVCFKYVFAGAGHFSTLQAESYLSITGIKLRDTIVNHILNQHSSDIDSSSTRQLDISAKPKRHRILIIQKAPQNTASSFNDFNHIYNYNEMVIMLQETLGDVADIVPFLPDNYTWAEQIRQTQRATVIFTPPGGGSFLTMYGKLNVAVIIADSNFGGNSVRSGNKFGTDESWYTNVKWAFNYLHYLVCASSEYYGDIHVVLPRIQFLIIKAMMMVEDSDLGSDIEPNLRMKTLFPIVNAKASVSYAVDIQLCSISVDSPTLNFNSTSKT